MYRGFSSTGPEKNVRRFRPTRPPQLPACEASPPSVLPQKATESPSASLMAHLDTPYIDP